MCKELRLAALGDAQHVLFASSAFDEAPACEYANEMSATAADGPIQRAELTRHASDLAGLLSPWIHQAQ